MRPSETTSTAPVSPLRQLKEMVIPPVGADGLTLGKAFIASTILSIGIFLVLALITVLFGGMYWLLSA